VNSFLHFLSPVCSFGLTVVHPRYMFEHIFSRKAYWRWTLTVWEAWLSSCDTIINVVRPQANFPLWGEVIVAVKCNRWPRHRVSCEVERFMSVICHVIACLIVCCWTNCVEWRLQWDWSEATVHRKDVWKCITTVSGGQYVITDSTTKKLQSSAALSVSRTLHMHLAFYVCVYDVWLHGMRSIWAWIAQFCKDVLCSWSRPSKALAGLGVLKEKCSFNCNDFYLL